MALAIARPKLFTRRLLAIAGIVFLVGALSLAAFIIQESRAHAASLANWNAGKIIDDSVFIDSSTMSASQIQSFLNSKVSNCDTNGTQTATDFGSSLTHAQYAASRGWSAPPYTCLKDYTENGKSAAQILYDTAQTYQINPQVLIVLLQKEEGLVTDTWPLATQYRAATGYGCPDSTPGVCDSQYYGFTNQVADAANMFHNIVTGNSSWYTPVPLGNWPIQYKPSTSCGSPVVSIQNRATQALYNYTPYQPNQAALNAGYGNGDSCSSYGNRNFYLYFTDWFGSTYAPNYAWKQSDKEIYTDESKTTPISENSIQRNQRFYVQIKALNTGNSTWYKGVANQQVNVGTSNSMDRRSVFCDADWLGSDCNRATSMIETSVAPGQVGTFEFWMTAPSKLGTYSEYFNLVMDGTSWLQDVGFYWNFTVSDNGSLPQTISTLTKGSSNSVLWRGQSLISSNSKAAFILDNGGFGELFYNLSSIWKLTVAGKTASHLALQSDGNLVLYDTTGSPIWATGTSTGNTLQLLDNGNLVLYNSSNAVIWSSATPQDPAVTTSSLSDGSNLYRGQTIKSQDGKYTLALQKDGNLVLYSPSKAIWATGTTDGMFLAQQKDGNLVLYGNNGRAVWSNGQPVAGAATYLQLDGNFVTYTSAGKPIWASNSGGWQN